MDFEIFWREYPRKVGRLKAEKLWNKLGSFQRADAMDGLFLWKQTTQWQADGGIFIPYASTFLAQKRYLDEAWAGCFDEPKPEPQKISDTEPLTPKLQAVRDRIFAREQGNKR